MKLAWLAKYFQEISFSWMYCCLRFYENCFTVAHEIDIEVHWKVLTTT